MRKSLACVAGLLLLAACNPDDVVHRVGWFATMRHQRSIKPYAMPRSPVEGTVPVTGTGVVMVDAKSADRLVNPRARTAESLNRGKWNFDIYCAVCHGPAGRGDGPLSATAGGPFYGIVSFLDPTRPKLSDGYIFGMITNAPRMGRGLMPIYGEKVRGTDRWDVINYLRSLQEQGRAGGAR